MGESPYNVQMDFAALRADLIGQDVVIRTPFGVRQVTYADYVASGKPLRSVERRIEELVLPLYANLVKLDLRLLEAAYDLGTGHGPVSPLWRLGAMNPNRPTSQHQGEDS